MAEKVDSIHQNNHLIRNKNIMPPKSKPTSAPTLHSSVTVAVYWLRSSFDRRGTVIERECFLLGPMHLVGDG